MVKKQTTIDDLAVMVKKGFDYVDKRFNDVDKRFNAMDKKIDEFKSQTSDNFNYVYARLDTIEHDIQDMRGKIVYHDEFEDLMIRVKYIEKKLGIESGV